MCYKKFGLVIGVNELRGDIQKIIDSHSEIKRWAYILHDKDVEETHYHVYLEVSFEVDRSKIADWFGVDAMYVVQSDFPVRDVFFYFLHWNNPSPYVYSLRSIKTNIDINNNDIERE
jgi:hypothetical protein